MAIKYVAKNRDFLTVRLSQLSIRRFSEILYKKTMA